MINKKDKPGINRAIICKKCGHRVGHVKIKQRFKWNVFLWIFVIALVTQTISEVVGRLLFGDYQ